MKYITKYKSPNYNSRKNSKIKLIVIHYTALKNTQIAISYLSNKQKKVSAHYLISQDGKVYLLVKEKNRAWHAGHSFWNNFTDINSISIGIELDYSPNGKNNKFSYKMISSLKKVLFKLQNKYKISKKNILAHSDIAPFRKKDPGKYFPWDILYLSKITLNFAQVKKNHIKIMEDWFNNHKIKSKKKIIILALSLIGYDTRNVYKDHKTYNKLISAYKLRYINYNDKQTNDLLYKTLMKHLFKFLLTKN
tara:strand:+ start:731 stop:1477 length:747 start_codon:yes stop_codon:yes gene_type:complete